MSAVEIYIARAENTLKERYEKIATNIIKGGCSSFEDYKHRVGTLKGLEDALSELSNAYQEMMKEHDE